MELDRASSRIAVIAGGWSAEREVSLRSGAAVAEALRRRGWTVTVLDLDESLAVRLVEEGVSRAWLALHGRFGEDGAIQGLLEVLRIPYTGSSVQSSAQAMDKLITRQLLDGLLPLPRGQCWTPGVELPSLSYPVFVKDPHGGSTLGIQACPDRCSLEQALEAMREDCPRLLIEEGIQGPEITVAVLDGRPLPPVLIEPASDHFDFQAKYTKGQTRYTVPAPLPAALLERAQELAVLAYRALQLHGLARADFIVDAERGPVFLEFNTIPGMTETSLAPMAAQAAGIPFDELVETLLKRARLHLSPAAQQR